MQKRKEHRRERNAEEKGTQKKQEHRRNRNVQREIKIAA